MEVTAPKGGSGRVHTELAACILLTGRGERGKEGEMDSLSQATHIERKMQSFTPQECTTTSWPKGGKGARKAGMDWQRGREVGTVGVTVHAWRFLLVKDRKNKVWAEKRLEHKQKANTYNAHQQMFEVLNFVDVHISLYTYTQALAARAFSHFSFYHHLAHLLQKKKKKNMASRLQICIKMMKSATYSST